VQTSEVFNQRAWPGAGDVDDCWVLSAIQCVNVVAPWLALPTVPAFRKAAGDPDDGKNDGGNLAEISLGIRTTWPVLAGRLQAQRGVAWATLAGLLLEHRPASIAVVSSKLPPRLRYGFQGLHQVTLAVSGQQPLLANPLAPPHSRWDRVTLAELQPAILAYGQAKAGKPGAWAVAFPTDAEAIALHPLVAPEHAASRREGYSAALEAAAAAIAALSPRA